MGMAAILIMWSGPFEQIFVPLSKWCSIWNLATIGPVVSEEKTFENVDNIHTYILTTDAYLFCKLTTEPKGSGELINVTIFAPCYLNQLSEIKYVSHKPRKWTLS